MDIKKLLGLLFEHIESGDITSFDVNELDISLDDGSESIRLNGDILKQYNKIFGYE